jgi:hypothetical protein
VSANLRVLVMLLLGCSVLMLVSPVYSGSDVDTARAKYQEAQKLFEKFQYAEAAKLFREAHDMSPNWRLLYNMAQSEAAARNFGPALQYFEQYLALGGDEVLFERKEEVLAEIRRMRDMVAFVEIHAPEGCEVLVNGVMRDKTPLPGPLMINAGVENVLVVQHDGTVLLNQRIRMTSQQTRTINVKAKPAVKDVEETDEKKIPKRPEEAAEQDADLLAVPDKASPSKKVGVILLGVGAASGLTGMVTGIGALKINKRLESEHGTVLPQEEESTMNRMNALATVSNITLIAGGTLAVTGIILFFLGRKNKTESSVSLVPVVAPGQAGLHLERSF